MPQADEGLRAKMERRFGGHSEEGPIRFLEAAGYTLTRGWEWEPKPGVQSLHDMSEDERDCLLFLVDEWDFGALAIERLPSLQA